MKDLFIGTWRLLEDTYEAVNDGESFSLLGKNAFGLLIYTVEGYMSVFLSKANRPNFITDDPMQGTPEEQSNAFMTHAAYCGHFTIDEVNKAVIHHIEGAWFPNWVNISKLRYYSFHDDKLTLCAPPQKFAGKEYIAKLIWQKV
ncbi:MAG: lipocalin-like domain-containing protein [Coxiellaceae bacterium]|nr:MAG: lipocalin-like domain-containing protein [Coxiellaceae bacterium]